MDEPEPVGRAALAAVERLVERGAWSRAHVRALSIELHRIAGDDLRIRRLANRLAVLG